MWGQEDYFVVPDSAVTCQGFTYNSRDYSIYMVLQSRAMVQGSLVTTQRRVFNPTTNTFQTRYELHLASWGPRGPGVMTLGSREHGDISAPPAPGWLFGRFTQAADGAVVVKRALGYTPTNPPYKVTLAAPFAIKRRTDVSVTPTRVSGRRLALTIRADRNASFQNGVAPTYRRQVVIPTTPADHAVIKRGSKVLRRVVLSPYGSAKVVIPDIRGANKYSVTMVATNDNFAGIARFAR